MQVVLGSEQIVVMGLIEEPASEMWTKMFPLCFFFFFFPSLWLKAGVWLELAGCWAEAFLAGAVPVEFILLLFTESHSYSKEEISFCSKNKFESLKLILHSHIFLLCRWANHPPACAA